MSVQDLSPVKVGVSGTIRVDVEVDLVAYFNAIPPSVRDAYWALDRRDLQHWGFDQDHERPLAFLLGDLDGDVGTLHFGATGVRDRSDVCVEWGDVGYGWTEDHYHRLLAFVPWLRPPDIDPEDEEAYEHALARRPGPMDQPLFPERGAVPDLPPGYYRDVTVRGDLL